MIERLVHRVWVGGPEPDWTRRFAHTWRQPGWELRQWAGPEELHPLRNQDVYDRAAEIAPGHVGQLRSDVLRYEILERYGGIYVDADFECLRPIGGLLGAVGASCFAAWEQQDRWIANGLMGAVSGHPFITLLIDGLADRVAARAGQRPNRLTGPHYLTETWRAHGDGVTVFPEKWFYPYGWREIRAHGPAGTDWGPAYAVHHWANQRREQGVPVG